MPDTEAHVEPLHADTMRVRYIPAVEVGGVRHQAGTYEADVTVDEAHALLEAGRVELVGDEPAQPATPAPENDVPADHQL